MPHVNRLDADFDRDHVTLDLLLGVMGVADLIRSVPDGRDERARAGDPHELDLVLLGVLALDDRLRSVLPPRALQQPRETSLPEDGLLR